MELLNHSETITDHVPLARPSVRCGDHEGVGTAGAQQWVKIVSGQTSARVTTLENIVSSRLVFVWSVHIIINRVGNKWIPQHIPGDESVSLVPSWFLPSHYYNKTQHTKMKNTWFKCFSSQVDKSYLNKIIALSTLYFHRCSMMCGSSRC